MVFPGGFGAAKNLSTFGVSDDPEVDPEVARVVRDFRDAGAGHATGMACIAPVLAALVTARDDGRLVKLTLGGRGEGWPYAGAIDRAEGFGAEVVEAGVGDVVVDPDCRLVTTPAFMCGDARFHEVADGVAAMVDEVIKLTEETEEDA